MRRLKSLAVGVLCLGAASAFYNTNPASATSLTINTFDNGWYSNDGWQGNFDSSDTNNTNIFVGLAGNDILNNWFAFDLAAAAGQTVTSATLTVFANNGKYVSPDASETWGLFDFTGSIDALVGGTGGTGAYGDLGSGNSYGQTTVFGTSGDPMPELSIALSLAALTAINSAIGSADQRFAIGGTLLSILGGRGNEALFSLSNGVPAARLTFEVAQVPLPAALPMFLAGLAGLGLFGWRKSKRATPAQA